MTPSGPETTRHCLVALDLGTSLVVLLSIQYQSAPAALRVSQVVLLCSRQRRLKTICTDIGSPFD